MNNVGKLVPRSKPTSGTQQEPAVYNVGWNSDMEEELYF